MTSNPYAQYRQNAVATAAPGELTLMLYNGAVKFIRQGAKHIEENNIEGAHNAIVQAQEIIAYLRETLNLEYDISKNLDLLYDFITRRLAEANIKKDRHLLEEALALVEDLRDTWAQALKLASPAFAANL